MSIYPAPNQSSIFNAIDYNTNDDINDECCDESNSDLSNYVKKNEAITVPTLNFFDNSIQSSAFTNSMAIQMETNTTNIEYEINKNQGVSFDTDNYTQIDDLKTTNLKINGTMTNAFTSTDKNKIYENEGNIILHNDRISALETVDHTDETDLTVLNNKTQNISTNTSNGLTEINGDINLTGDNIKMRNAIYHNEVLNQTVGQVGALNDTNSVFHILGNNGVYIQATTGNLSLIGKIPSLTFSDNSVQNYAFTNELLLDVVSNKSNISVLLSDTRNINYIDDIDGYTEITKLKTDNDFMVNNEKYADKMNAYDSKNLNQDISISDNRIDIDSNINSIVNLRNDVDANIVSISSNTSQINTNTNSINNIQSSLSSNKMFITIGPDMNIVHTPFLSGQNTYNSNHIYKISDHSDFNSYTVNANNWSAPRFFSSDLAGRRLMINYSVNFTSTQSSLKTFYSRLALYNNISNEGSASLDIVSEYSGLNRVSHWDNWASYLYNGSWIIQLNGNNESIVLHTFYDLQTSNGAIDLKCKIQVIEL